MPKGHLLTLKGAGSHLAIKTSTVQQAGMLKELVLNRVFCKGFEKIVAMQQIAGFDHCLHFDIRVVSSSKGAVVVDFV